MLLILAVVSVALLFYFFGIRPLSYWKTKGVKHGRSIPFLGEGIRTFIGRQSMGEFMQQIYQSFPDTRYSGILHLMSQPILVVRDPDLIKQITVKDFDHFVDHQTIIPEDIDPYWAKNLFALKGKKWRHMRSVLSPAFTSSKMKQMFVLILECAEQFSQHFIKKRDNLIECEMKDVFGRFTNDVIASTAFGIKVDSLTEPDNEFYQYGTKISALFSLSVVLKLIVSTLLPPVSKILDLGFIPKTVSRYFFDVVTGNIRTREEKGIVRPDLINLLMEARKQGLKHEEAEQADQDTGFATVKESEIGKANHQQAEVKTDVDFSDEAVTAQALIFFMAGFDSVSSGMAFMAYELGINPDVQDRLRREIDGAFEESQGRVTYEAVLKLEYLDMVVSETLRLWPPSVFIDRICTRPYTIQPQLPGEKALRLDKGELVWIPVFGLHRDADHFPEPDRFDPERFSEENKTKIKTGTYMPFGSGPRACIGSRFALLEIKALFFYLLLNFEIVPTGKTKVPVRMSRKSFGMIAEDGFWFGLKRRVR